MNSTSPSSLRSLDVSHNHLSLLNFSSSTSITHLNVSHNSLTTLFGLKHCPNLTSLDASNNDLCHLHGLTSASSLSTLDVSYNQINYPDFAVLSLNKALTKLVFSLFPASPNLSYTDATKLLSSYLPFVSDIRVIKLNHVATVDLKLSDLDPIDDDSQPIMIKDVLNRESTKFQNSSAQQVNNSSINPFLGSFCSSRVLPPRLRSRTKE
ncbi:hypothetical protein GEMRC1_010595 [Eukaryota sp. GEM-RC1]